MIRHILISIIALAASAAVSAQQTMPTVIHWKSEQTDTVRINRLLADASAIDSRTVQGRVGQIARLFIGTPYAASTLEIAPEGLVINLDSLDCTTFVENVAALALTVGEGRNAWQDFLHNLTQIRYRGGVVNGYASRLHYISEWILDNEHRGNLTDVTDLFPGVAYEVKTLDYMTTHRDSYPAMADEAVYQEVKDKEIGYRSHRYPYIKTGSLHNRPVVSALLDGDIVALVCRTKGLDVSHMGIIVIEDGRPHLLHASSKEGKVVIDRHPLDEYMRKSRNLQGLRILRLSDR